MNYQEALKAAKEYYGGEELAASVFLNKYAVKNPSGEYEEDTPDKMHRRLSKEFYSEIKECSIKSKYFSDEESVYELFKDFKYIVPQGSIMSQLGHPYSTGSLSNCFVVGTPYDSYAGILQKDQELVQLMKRRGGVGIDISTLRPDTTPVKNAAGSSTGAVSFMHRFSNTTREVAQNGRRGALMISMDINHPDVLDFIKIKRDLTQVTGANISIKLNDEFMKAVEEDKDYILRFPCDAEVPNYVVDYDKLLEINTDEDTVHIRRIKAREYWDEIIKSAHGVAEPGLMFWDNMVNYSPDGVYHQYRQVTTNPCSEIAMQPYDACRLICMNLFSVVEEPFTIYSEINYDLLYDIAYRMQLLADTVVDLEVNKIVKILDKIEEDPEPEEVKYTEFNLWKKVLETAQNSRRTGTGFTALGDMIAALGLKYDSPEAMKVIEKVMRTKLRAELNASIDLAKENGPFEGWNPSLEVEASEDPNSFYHTIRTEFPVEWVRMLENGRRNVSWSTVAPTGTVSLMTQTTSGLEPLFMAYYMRRKKVNPNDEDSRVDFTDQNGDTWQEFPVLHPKFKEWITINVDESTAKPIEDYSETELKELFEKSPWYKSTANDIDWIQRVEIQGLIQKYITHSISSTINLPNDVKEEEVSEIYLESWHKGLKGITVYRDGSRSGVLVSSDSSPESFKYSDAPKRPKCLPVDIYTTVSKGKKWNVIVGLYDSIPYEVFAIEHFTNKEKGELCKVSRGHYDLVQGEELILENITSKMTAEEDALTRMVSTALRHGADITFIVEQLNKSFGDITSFGKATARILKKYADPALLNKGVTCNECGSSNVVFEEGCYNCKDCGASGCS